jgi:hypothetical protein
MRGIRHIFSSWYICVDKYFQSGSILPVSATLVKTKKKNLSDLLIRGYAFPMRISL